MLERQRLFLQVEELRQQLRLLQAVGFGSLEAEDGQPSEHTGPGKALPHFPCLLRCSYRIAIYNC